MTTTQPSCATLDLRSVAPQDRHSLVFTTFKGLPPGAALQVINDHNPLPLRGQFDSGLFGAFRWTALESGPQQWRIEILKPADSKPVHGVDSCCGACGG